jgi:hypothetical protein
MKCVFTALLIVGVIPFAMAQAAQPATWSPAKSIHQTPRSIDRSEMHDLSLG